MNNFGGITFIPVYVRSEQLHCALCNKCFDPTGWSVQLQVTVTLIIRTIMQLFEFLKFTIWRVRMNKLQFHTRFEESQPRCFWICLLEIYVNTSCLSDKKIAKITTWTVVKLYRLIICKQFSGTVTAFTVTVFMGGIWMATQQLDFAKNSEIFNHLYRERERGMD